MRAAKAVALMLAASLAGIVGWAAYRAHWVEPFAGARACAEESPQTLKDSIIEYGHSSSGVVGTYITLLSIDESGRAVLGDGLGAPFPVGETQMTPEELATVQRTIERAGFAAFQSCYGRRAEVNPQNSWIFYRRGAKEKLVVWMSVPRDPKPPQGWVRIVDMLDEIRERAEKQEPIREALSEIANGKLDPIPLSVTYDDMHGLWGGLTLTIQGNGHVQQKAVKMAVRTPTQVSRDGILKLVRLLLQERAWEQREPERAPEPDESKARLVVEYGKQRSEIWEWYNDLDKNQRLGKIRDLMKAIAF